MTDQPTMTSAQMVERSSGATAWWIFEHQDGDKFFADRDPQHGKMIANAYWGENTWTKMKLYASPPAPPAGEGGMREALEKIADAIDLARYQHPEHPRERPRPFSEADTSDREYALRLARAALSQAALSPSAEAPGDQAGVTSACREALEAEWPDIAEDDPHVVAVAHAIAEHGIGRSWNSFLPTNAYDIDHSDLIEYARAAVSAMRALSAAQSSGGVDDNALHFAARALALAEPSLFEDKDCNASLQPNQRARDVAAMVLSAAKRHAALSRPAVASPGDGE